MSREDDEKFAQNLFEKIKELRDNRVMMVFGTDEEILKDCRKVGEFCNAVHGMDVSAYVLMLERDRWYKSFTQETLVSSKMKERVNLLRDSLTVAIKGYGSLIEMGALPHEEWDDAARQHIKAFEAALDATKDV